MAYKKDIKPFLKENGYTWEDMDRFWSECCEVNWKCKMIAEAGKNWSDLTMYQIEQLPTLKETTLAQIKQKEEDEKKKAEEEKRKQDEKKYYEEHFEEILVKKIDAGEPLTESELSDMRDFSIERDYGENRRWQRSVYDICMMCGRYFALTWEEGLTESQENEFFEQPYEVYKKTTIIVEKKDCFVSNNKITGKPSSKDCVLNKFSELFDDSKDYVFKSTSNGFEVTEI